MGLSKIQSKAMTGTLSKDNITIDMNTFTEGLVSKGISFEMNGGLPTPTGKTRTVYNYTGSNQSLDTSSINYVFAKCWGAGGGGGTKGGWGEGSMGGGGGYTYGLIDTTSISTLYIVVGQGGPTNFTSSPATRTYGGGGSYTNNSDRRYGGQGGGYSGIFTSGTLTQGAALLIAGGGGGGGSSRDWTGNKGGAGGGLRGEDGLSPYDGKQSTTGSTGGTQTSGGIGQRDAGEGIALGGGQAPHGGYGGGGGGGYYGGGAGEYEESNTMAGGAGGSGFVSNAIIFGATIGGSGQSCGAPGDVDAPTMSSGTSFMLRNATGGEPTADTTSTVADQAGGHGYVVLYY